MADFIPNVARDGSAVVVCFRGVKIKFKFFNRGGRFFSETKICAVTFGDKIERAFRPPSVQSLPDIFFAVAQVAESSVFAELNRQPVDGERIAREIFRRVPSTELTAADVPDLVVVSNDAEKIFVKKIPALDGEKFF